MAYISRNGVCGIIDFGPVTRRISPPVGIHWQCFVLSTGRYENMSNDWRRGESLENTCGISRGSEGMNRTI